MDEWLANVYGTKGASEQIDLEKVAQMAILEKLAGEEGYDLSGLTEEQALELADEIMTQGAEGQEQQAAPQQAAPQQQGQEQQEPNQEQVEIEMAKEAQAKFEEADFLGRVMAHAYTQELEKIAYMGSKESLEERRQIARGHGRISGGLGALGGAISGAGSGGSTAARVLKGALGAAGGGAAGYGAQYAGSRLAAGLGHAAGGGHLVGGGDEKGKKSKSKTASAFEKLAEDRAVEILQANGIDPTQQQQEPQQQQEQVQEPQQGQPQEMQASPDDQFEAALNARAVEMLRENGYQVE